MDTDALTAAETLIRAADESLTAPHDRECLLCYLERMVTEFGCVDGLRWAEHWRRRNAPNATGLLRRLKSGGGYCDCEVLMNVYPEYLREDDGPVEPCRGVTRRGSTKPCRPRAAPRELAVRICRQC